jgi:hypothetical protein
VVNHSAGKCPNSDPVNPVNVVKSSEGAREREEFKGHASTTRFLGEVSEVDQSSHVAGSTLGMISVKLMVPITSIAVATTKAQ